MKNRESGIELLRIISMLAIVAGHFVNQGVVVCNGFLPYFVSSAARIAVDVFLLIGCWFMVDKPFRPNRMIKIYAEVVFYSVPITIVMFALGYAGGLRNVVQGCLPFFGRSVWFASAYISLIALSPFLNGIFKMPRRQLDALVVLLFILFPVVSTIPQFTPFEYLADFSWFPVVYVFVGWFKRHPKTAWRLPPTLAFLMAIMIYAVLCIGKMTVAAPLSCYWLRNLRGLPAILSAALLFYSFRSLRLGTRPWINRMAQSSFAVYVVHQIPAFEQFEWSLFDPQLLNQSGQVGVAFGISLTAVVVFVAVSLIDAVRIKFIEPWFMRLRFVRMLAERIESFYGQSPLPNLAG